MDTPWLEFAIAQFCRQLLYSSPRNIPINLNWLLIFYLPLYNPTLQVMTISFQIFLAKLCIDEAKVDPMVKRVQGVFVKYSQWEEREEMNFWIFSMDAEN